MSMFALFVRRKKPTRGICSTFVRFPSCPVRFFTLLFFLLHYGTSRLSFNILHDAFRRCSFNAERNNKKRNKTRTLYPRRAILINSILCYNQNEYRYGKLVRQVNAFIFMEARVKMVKHRLKTDE